MPSRFLSIIKLAFAAWILWFLTHSNLLQPAVLMALLRPVPALGMALATLSLGVFLAAYRWYLLLRVQGMELSFSRCLMPSYTGFGLNQFLPGGVGGDVVRLAFLVRALPNAKARGVTTLLADRALGLVALMTLTLVSFVVYRDALPDHPHLRAMVDLCAVGMALALVCALVAVVLPDDVGLSRWMMRRISHAPLLAAVVNTLAALHSFRRMPWQVAYAFGVSILVQALAALALLYISRVMGFSIPFWHLVLASSVAQIASAVPLTPGGIGVGEAAFAATLALLGYPAALGLGSVLMGLRVLSIVLALPGYALYVSAPAWRHLSGNAPPVEP